MHKTVCGILLILFCFLAGCESDAKTPVEPLLMAESKSTFNGIWRGGLAGDIILKSNLTNPLIPDSLKQKQILSNWSCTLELWPFMFQLEMHQQDEGTATVYKQTGVWGWASDQPHSLVFFYDSTTIEQTKEIGRVRIQSQNGSKNEGSWACSLEFAPDYDRLILSNFEKEPVVVDWSSAREMTLKRQVY